VRTGRPADFNESFLTLLRNAQRVGAPVVRVFTSGYQTTSLQINCTGSSSALPMRKA
jgi:hypothetical protein